MCLMLHHLHPDLVFRQVGHVRHDFRPEHVLRLKLERRFVGVGQRRVPQHHVGGGQGSDAVAQPGDCDAVCQRNNVL